MMNCSRMRAMRVLLAAWLGAFVLVSAAQADEYYDKYDLKPNAKYLSMGVQPMAYPLAFISSTLQRDRLLREELKKAGRPVQLIAIQVGENPASKLYTNVQAKNCASVGVPSSTVNASSSRTASSTLRPIAFHSLRSPSVMSRTLYVTPSSTNCAAK